MTRSRIADEYFEWLVDLVCKNRFSKQNSYRQLLACLHDINFMYKNVRDQDRYTDGLDLRHRYSLECGYEYIPYDLDGPCSVLEMILALAIRCEETIMDDPAYGNRTGQWFWNMISSLGLSHMVDRIFDVEEVEYIIRCFLYRDYDSDGRGGLFTIRNCEYDLRDVDIWTQLNWYLDEYYAT